MKELKKRTKVELLEEVNKHKKRTKIFLIILLILALYLIYNYVQGGIMSKNKLIEELKCQDQLETYFHNQTNTSISEFKKTACEDSSITRTVNSFFDNFLRLDKPWIVKLMIFLGVVYLIQITFTLVMDIIEVLMLIFVVIKRIYKWIKSLFKKEEQDG